MPKPIRLYWNVISGNLISPAYGGSPTQRIIIPREDHVAIQVQVVTSDRFVPDANGYAPASVCYDLSDYEEQDPVFGIKLREDWNDDDEDDPEYAASFEEFEDDDDWHNPDSGRICIAGTLLAALTPGDDYMGQITLVDADDNRLSIPTEPIAISVLRPVVLS